MANKKINQLVSKTAILSTDIFGIGDATTGQLFKKTIAELQAAIGGAVISVNGSVGTVVLDTDDIQELASPTNKYFTDARARGAISLTVTGNSGASTYSNATGVLNVPTYTLTGLGGITASFLSGTSGISYNSTTGVISYTGTVYTDESIRSLLSASTGLSYNNSTGVFTNTITQYTDALARLSLSAGTGISYSNTTGVITSTITQYTDALARASISGGTGISYSSGTGIIASTITQYTDALARASISLTTTGNSGLSTWNPTTGVLNVPAYTLVGLGGITATFLSGTSGISYNSTTGVISYSGTVYTDASIRALFSGGTGISYNSSTGAISYSGTVYTDSSVRALISMTTTGTSGASTYNNTTGVINVPNYTLAGLGGISLTSLSGGTGITYNNTTGAISYSGTVYTDASVRALISASGAVSYNNTTGVISLTSGNLTEATSSVLTITGGTGAVLGSGTSIQVKQATTSVSGFLSSTDWTTFNNKANALSGTTNYIAKFTSASTIGNSLLIDQGAYIESTANMVISNATTYRGLSITTTTASARPTLSFVNTNYVQYGSYIQDINGRLDFGRMNSDFTGHTPSMTLDASGNLGLGVTPSAWGSAWKAIRVEFYGAISSTQSDASINLTSNAYNNGTNWIYTETGVASTLFTGKTSGFQWYTAPSGTAGNAISFTQAMTLASSGNLLLGTTTDNGSRLQVQGNVRFNYSDNFGYFGIGYISATNYGFYNYNYGRADLLFTQTTGAATFSSSVTALKYIANSQATYASLTYEETFKYASSPAGIWFGNSFNSNNNVGLQLRVSNDGTSVQALTISPTGNLGIGTTDIRNNGAGQTAMQITGTSFPLLSLNGTSNSVGVNTGINSLGGYIGTYTNHNFTFTTSDTERMRIASGGNVLIGTTTDSGFKLDVNGTASVSGDISVSNAIRYKVSGAEYGVSFANAGAFGIEAYQGAYFYIGTGAAGTATERMRITSGGNILMGTTSDNGERLYVSGAIRATSTITANSDIRIKNNITKIENALEKVGQISGYTYNTNYDDKRHGGVIAQEIYKVFPEIVNTGNDGLMGVEYGNISALLIEAIKEQNIKIKNLETLLASK